MHGLVIDVGAVCGGDGVTPGSSLGLLTEMLLLVTDKVLRTSDDTSILNTLDGFSKELTSDVWVGSEA